MMTKPMMPIDRQFALGDHALLEQLIQGLVNQQCVAWRKSYGRTGSLHYGGLVRRPPSPKKVVHQDEGVWIVGLWDCDRRLLALDGQVIDSRETGDDAFLPRLGALEGTHLRSVEFDEQALCLQLKHSNGLVLQLLPDPVCSSQDEQWSVQLPTRVAVAVFGKRRWTVEADVEGGDRPSL